MLSTSRLSQTFRNGNPWFVAAFLLITLLLCWKFPSLSWKAELWAESGHIYLPQALDLGFFGNLFKADGAGYFALAQRLTAYFSVHVPGLLDFYPYLLQIIALGFVAFTGSFFCCRVFRSVVRSDVLRFVAGIGFVLVADYETYTFLNFMVVGFPFVLMLAYYVHIKRPSTFIYVLVSVAWLLILSKAIFAVLVLPLLVLFVQEFFTKKRKHVLVLLSASVLLCLFQGVFTLLHQDFLQSVPGHVVEPLWTQVSASFVLWFKSLGFYLDFLQLTGLGSTTVNGVYAVNALLLFVLFGFFVLRPNQALVLPSLAVFLSSLAMTFLVVHTPVFFDYYRSSIDADHFGFPFANRHFFPVRFIGYATAVLILQACLKSLGPRKALVALPYALVVFASYGTVSFLGFSDPYAEKGSSFSNWEAFKGQLRNDAYYVPVNPYNWSTIRNEFALLEADSVPVAGIEFRKRSDTPTIVNTVMFAKAPGVSIRALRVVSSEETRDLPPTVQGARYDFFLGRLSLEKDSRIFAIDGDGHIVVFSGDIKVYGQHTTDELNLLRLTPFGAGTSQTPLPELLDGTVVTQRFDTGGAKMSSVLVQLATWARKNSGTTQLLVLDAQGRTVGERMLQNELVVDNAFVAVDVPNGLSGAGTLKIVARGAAQGKGITAWTGETSLGPGFDVSYNGDPRAGKGLVLQLVVGP